MSEEKCHFCDKPATRAVTTDYGPPIIYVCQIHYDIATQYRQQVRDHEELLERERQMTNHCSSSPSGFHVFKNGFCKYCDSRL